MKSGKELLGVPNAGVGHTWAQWNSLKVSWPRRYNSALTHTGAAIRLKKPLRR